MRVILASILIFNFISLGKSQEFKLFGDNSVVHAFLEVGDGYVALTSYANSKNGKPNINLIKWNTSGKLLNIKTISDENFSINRFENMYYEAEKQKLTVIGFRHNQNDSSVIDILSINPDLSIINKNSIPLSKGLFYSVIETDLFKDRLLVYGYNASNKVNKFVIIFDLKSNTYISNENANNNTTLHDMILLNEPNELLLSNFGLATTDYFGTVLNKITDATIKQKGASNGDKFSRDLEDNLLLFSTGALVANIYSTNTNLKSIIYSIIGDKKVKKWKQVGDDHENPCQTKSISVLDDKIFTGSFPFTGPFLEQWSYFRVTKLDKNLNVKWSNKITPDFERFCLLMGVEALKDGGCMAYGALREPGLDIYDPRNFNTGFMLRFDSLGNIVPFDMATSLKEVVDEDLAIYPNPAKNELFIRSSSGITSSVCRIKVYNQLGQLVKDEAVNEKVNIESLNNGLYLYKITRNEKLVKSGKFIKIE